MNLSASPADPACLVAAVLTELPSRDYTIYGRHVACYEEAGFVVAGHDRRSWAAANHMAREVYDERRVGKRIEPRWSLFYDTCGCTEAEHAAHGDDCYDHCEEVRHGLPPCSDMYGWMTDHVTEGTPGAVPILEYR